jgi:TolB-like protein
MSAWAELKRRKVLQTGATYVVGALALWGGIDFSAEAFGLPSSVLRYAVIASAIGLPLALIASWFLEVRFEGDREEGHASTSQVVFASLGLGALVGALSFMGLVATLGVGEESGGTPETAGLGERAAVAVLPFEDLSPDQSQVHFADGIADEIRTSLQAWGAFPVISRGSTFEYRDRRVDVPTIAAELGVRYVVEGGVRVDGDAVRVTSQLVDAESDTQLWADRFDGELRDVFAVQDEIAERIATAIAPEITRSEMRRATRNGPKDLAAWELVLRAQAILANQTQESAEQARGLLELALERDPGYALAYARLAEIGHDTSNNMSREFGNEAAIAALDAALDQARQAVQLDPSLVDARIWYGHLLLHHRFVAEGLVQLEEAVRLNPSHAQAHAELAFGLAMKGDVETAMSELSIATRLSPNDPRNDRIMSFEALAKLYAGDDPGAAESARRVISAQPGSPVVLVAAVVEISALARQGRTDEALQRAAEFEEAYGPIDWPAFARGAWTEAELARVRADLVAVEMLPQ